VPGVSARPQSLDDNFDEFVVNTRSGSRNSRNSGGFGTYSPLGASSLSGVPLNPQQAPPLPDFPTGYTLYLHRRPQYGQQSRFRKHAAAIAKEPQGINVGGVLVGAGGGDEGDENRTETDSIDGDGAESLDGKNEEGKDSEQQLQSQQVPQGVPGVPAPGPKIVGWRSDTILTGVSLLACFSTNPSPDMFSFIQHPSGRKFKSAAEFLIHIMFLYVTDHDMKAAQGLAPKETTGPPPLDYREDDADGDSAAANGSGAPASPDDDTTGDVPPEPKEEESPSHGPAEHPTALPDYHQCPCPSCAPWVSQQEKERLALMKTGAGADTEDEEHGGGVGKRRRVVGRKKGGYDADEMNDPQSRVSPTFRGLCAKV